MSSDARTAFSSMRPYCVDFLQSQDILTLRKLHAKLLEIEEDSLSEIAQYVLFPFRLLLKKQKSGNEAFMIESVKCLSFIFSRVTINDWAVVNEFLTQLCIVLTDRKDKELGATGSEELKETVASAIGSLLNHALLPVHQQLYHFSSIPLLGHIVTLLLSIASDNISKSSRISALKALKSLGSPAYCSLLEESTLNATNGAIGDCLACFLPGVSSSLSKVLVSNASAGYKVKVLCMDVLATFITMSVGDDTIPTPSQHQDKSGVNPKLRALVIERDQKWISSVSAKLGPIINNVCSASNSDNWNVRLGCVEFCEKVLLMCKKNLESHISAMLMVLIKLLNDSYEQVRKPSKRVLDDFSLLLQEGKPGSHVLVEIL